MMNDKQIRDLLETALGIICNAQPDASLDQQMCGEWNEARDQFIEAVAPIVWNERSGSEES